MDDPGCRTDVSLTQYFQRIRSRFTRVNDQRQSGLPARIDVPAKAVTLPIEIALAAKVVEPGFAYTDDRACPAISTSCSVLGSNPSLPSASVFGCTPTVQKTYS